MGRREPADRGVPDLADQWLEEARVRLRLHVFFYDGWNVVLQIYHGFSITNKYTWGLDRSGSIHGAGGVGGLLAWDVATGEDFWYLYDANGNVTQMIDSSDSSTAAHYEYDPYGNLLTTPTGAGASNVFRFSTKYSDREVGTELYYYGYRYYSPTLGRWLNRDPFAELKFTPPTPAEDLKDSLDLEKNASENHLVPQVVELNLYLFVSNDSISAYDLLGLWELRCRKLSGWGSLSMQKHCWIECDGHSYSLLNKNKTATKVKDDPADKGKGKVDQSGTDKCDCIERQFNANKQSYPYDKDQCNSNYYAGALLGCCGINASRPGGAYGWNNCDNANNQVKCVSSCAP